MERFFSLIAKINSILLLLVLLIGSASISWVLWSSRDRDSRGVIEVAANDASSSKGVFLHLGYIHKITGTATQMLSLTAEDRSGKLYSGGYRRETRNLLFITGTEKKARWLFPNQSNLILVNAQLKEDSDDERTVPTKALSLNSLLKIRMAMARSPTKINRP